MKYSGCSVKGSYHSINQDSFIARRVRDVYILAVSDGLGSKKYSQIGSKMLCESLREVVKKNENILDLSSEELISTLQKKWLESINEYRVKDCYTTMLFLLIGKKKSFVARIGDGIITIITNKNKYSLFDKKEDSFLNETKSFYENTKIEDFEILKIENEEILGALLSTDGIDIYPNNKDTHIKFLEDFMEEYEGENLFKINDDIKRWISEWPSVDDKTLVYFIKE